MKQVRSDEARRTFRELLNEVEHQGEHVEILRYQTPAAMLVPVEWYKQARRALESSEDPK
jgi:prevent-host-death family protein